MDPNFIVFVEPQFQIDGARCLFLDPQYQCNQLRLKCHFDTLNGSVEGGEG